MIKQGVGVDNLELDNLDNEDLDRLLVKTTKVTEKVNIIKKAMKTSEKEVIAETVAKFLNMHKNEALSIIQVLTEPQSMQYNITMIED